MNNTIEYMGYIGSVEISEDSGKFYGSVQGISDLILYEGSTYKEFIDDFHEGIEHYISVCKDMDQEPQKSFKGSFNVRIEPELHKSLAIYAMNNKITLNKVVEKALNMFLVGNAS